MEISRLPIRINHNAKSGAINAPLKKRPRKHPKKLFSPHNKVLKMPEDLRSHYEKNNKK